MQALYAYDMAMSSVKEILAEEVSGKFKYDPAFHDFTDKAAFDKRVKFVKRTFLDKINLDLSPSDLDEDIQEALTEGQVDFSNALKKEHKSARDRMEAEIKNIYRQYIKILLIPSEIAFIERQEKERIEKKAKAASSLYNFISNPIVHALSTFKPLVDFSIDKNISWKGEEDTLKSWYKLWSANEGMMTYQSKAEPTEEDHAEALKLLLKNLAFKTEEVDEYFSLSDLHWSENKAIVRSMISKTIQGYEPSLDQPFELKELSLNEKDDFQYFRILFDKTIQETVELDATIAAKASNWDSDRMANLDKIILKMALVEMVNFPSIPVKVTINEFIEISKKYSTPKSKQFVNGILDVLANELTSEGIIRKSGRGLIDNK